jgi:hypothetical protein
LLIQKFFQRFYILHGRRVERNPGKINFEPRSLLESHSQTSAMPQQFLVAR